MRVYSMFLWVAAAWAVFVTNPDEELGLVTSNGTEIVPGSYIIQVAEGANEESVMSVLYQEGYDASFDGYIDKELRMASLFVYSDMFTSNHSVFLLLGGLDTVQRVWYDELITLTVPSIAATDPVWNPHYITGVDRLHKRGITGKGVTIGIIDSGLAVGHSTLGGSIGAGKKVISGTNFVNPENPIKDVTGVPDHGTFVSSIAAGKSNRFVGVAPDANIRFYKVGKPPKGSASTKSILAALRAAYNDKVDVISMSYGLAMTSYADHPVGLLTQGISQIIPVVIAAGNDGREGPFQAYGGAALGKTIAVGSVESMSLVTWPVQAVSGLEIFAFAYVSGTGSVFGIKGTFNVVYSDNLCTYSGNPTNNVLVGPMIGCTIGFVSSQAFFTQAQRVLVVDSSPMYDKDYDFGQIKSDAGDWIKEKSASGKVTIRFDPAAPPTMLDRTDIAAGKMAWSSTWGPSFINGFYPSVVAPGARVFGADLGGGYRIGSGTSYACPYVAGLIALYLGENPGTPATEVRNRLLTTAKLMPHFNGATEDTRWAHPVIQQGSGLVDAVSFLDSQTLFSTEPLISFGDVKNRPYHGYIRFTNKDFLTNVYLFRHDTALTVYTRKRDKGPTYSSFPKTLEDFAVATLRDTYVGASSITLNPGGQGEIFFTLKAPKDLATTNAPVWQGAFVISDRYGKEFSIPYMGIEVDTYAWDPLDSAPTFDPPLRGRRFENGEWPSANYYFNYGSPVYLFELVKENFNLNDIQPTFMNTKGVVASLTRTYKSDGEEYTRDVPTQFAKFGPQIDQITGIMGGGNVSPGRYRILTRALRVFGVDGDKGKRDDWQFFLSDVFNYRVDALEEPSSSYSSSSSDISSSSETSSSVSESSSSDSWVSNSHGGWHNSSSDSGHVTTDAPPGHLTDISKITTTTSTDNKEVTISCSECINGKVTTTTITRCSDGGYHIETVTDGDKRTVVVTVTTCTNGGCTPRVTLVVEQLYTTTVDGKAGVYTTTKSISVVKSGSESGPAPATSPAGLIEPNKASRLMGPISSLILVLMSLFVVL